MLQRTKGAAQDKANAGLVRELVPEPILIHSQDYQAINAHEYPLADWWYLRAEERRK